MKAWWFQIFVATDCFFLETSTRSGKTKKPHNERKDRTSWETHSCRMGKAWRCATLEKASSFLLPWQRTLLGNIVAMARVSSVKQTWPRPPTPHQLWRARLVLVGTERLHVVIIVCVCLRGGEGRLILSYIVQCPSPSCQLHWPMAPLPFRGMSPLLGLERTRNVRRRFTDRRLSATAGFWSQTSSHWLWSWTLYGSVHCGDRLLTKLLTGKTMYFLLTDLGSYGCFL